LKLLQEKLESVRHDYWSDFGFFVANLADVAPLLHIEKGDLTAVLAYVEGVFVRLLQ
jgi:hypothetical protein